MLCRHVFHCTLTELRRMEPMDILTTLNILAAEGEVRVMRRQLG